MNLLIRYIFKKISITSIYTLIAITVFLFILQCTRYFDLILYKGLKIKYLFYISILSMPSLWVELLPLVVFISTVLTWQVMINNNEIVIMQSSSLSPWQISKPVLLLGVISSLICLLFSLFIINSAFIKFTELKNNLQNNINISVIGSNKFIQLNKDITIYINDTDKEGFFKNVLIDNQTLYKEYAIFAENARMIKEENKIKILLQNGSIQKLNKQNKTVDFINFQFYVLEIPTNTSNKQTTIRTLEKEMYLWELLSPSKLTFMKKLKDIQYSDYISKVNKFTREANKRISNVVLSLCFAIIAAYFFSKNVFNRNNHLLPLYKSLASGLLLKSYVIIILINTSNIKIIIFSYILIISIALYMLLAIKRM